MLAASRIYQVGRLDEPPGWNHMGNDASNMHEVAGTVAIDVNERENSGTFVARLRVPEGDLVIESERFHEFNPCQDGGIAAYLYEHGDSGCGDTNWPKTFVWLAGWGFGKASLNGTTLYEDYQIHFMVTQGIRNRQSLKVDYPLLGKKSSAGAVNPSACRSTSTYGARSRMSGTTRREGSSITFSRWRSRGSERLHIVRCFSLLLGGAKTDEAPVEQEVIEDLESPRQKERNADEVRAAQEHRA